MPARTAAHHPPEVGTAQAVPWETIYAAMASAPAGAVWGVPRGGQIIAGLTGRAVDTPDAADVIVDDIIDSGATAHRYDCLYPLKQFWAPFRKRPGDGWLIFPWEQDDTTQEIEDTVRRQLEFLGEDPRREGLRETPRRVIAALQELTGGMRQDPSAFLAVQFTEPCDDMVLVRDIPYASLCEHHLLPFHGTATVGYIPRNNRIVGLSKIPRLVRCLARRLQTQERLTHQIAQALLKALGAEAVGVILTGLHTCMTLRGVRSQGLMTTSAMLGAFRDDPRARSEFLALAGGQR